MRRSVIMDSTERRSQTRAEFCFAEHLSKSTYHELKKRGLGPDELVVPGSMIIRITPEARDAWHTKMAELAKGEAARIEAERRREFAVIAGKAAAASPLHVSRRGSRSAPRHPRTRR
jgi:hypothetical protein